MLEDHAAQSPLPDDLTLRVLRYLAVFRILAAAGLLLLWWSNLGDFSNLTPMEALAATALIVYGAFAAWMAALAWRGSSNAQVQASLAISGDVYMLSMLVLLLGGPGTGLGILMIFAAAMAAVLMPVRTALFLAAVLTLAAISHAFLAEITADNTRALLEAGLYGVSIFTAAVLAHFMAIGVRDYRLTAERQEARAGRLEQISDLIIRRMRTGVLALDGDCRIQMHNESAWHLLGSPGPGVRDLEQIAPELHAVIERFIDDQLEPTEPVMLSGSQAEVLPRLVALPEDSDIRMLVFLEDNDVVAQRALQHSSATLAELSGSIAHEIRNPLSALTNAAQLLEESSSIGLADLRLVQIIDNQARRMNRIVENILQLSRREKSRPEIFDLEPMLEELVGEFAANHEDEIITKLDLEDFMATTAVMFDRSQLWQVIMKLMDNASEHAGAKGRRPLVMLALRRDEASGTATIVISDNGPGIRPEVAERIFEPFFTTRKEGSGLGLYIARQLCAANQAELTVDSVLGEGTRFRIRLPLTRGHAHRIEQETEIA